MENWKFSHTLAYILEDSTLYITDQCDEESGHVHTSKDDDFYVTKVHIDEDGLISFPEDFLDLRQFNNSWTLLNHILLIQEVAKNIGIPSKKLDIQSLIENHKVTLSNLEPEWRDVLGHGEEVLCGIDGKVNFKGKTWTFTSQEVKYTNIDSSITKETWSIDDLFEFTVGFQVAMQKAYKAEGLKGNYGQLDDQVRSVLQASA